MNKVHLDLGGGKLYQFSGKNGRQMMSYLIETPDGRLIMIDGGQYCDEDADFLEGFLINKGGRISAWFITHAHDDHFGALLRLLERASVSVFLRSNGSVGQSRLKKSRSETFWNSLNRTLSMYPP